MLEIEPATHDQKPVLRLTGELTIYAVAEAKGLLSEALDRHPALNLNLAGVEEMDTAGVQLLLWRTARRWWKCSTF